MATKALSFDVGDYVVYPKHGVGRVVELQSTEIAGTRLDLYVLRFEKEKMTLRVPVNKADSVGMRKLSSDKTMKDALETLKGKPKVKRTMWSRRAQEYEAKINSGDLTSIAEVTRDLFRPDDAPEQSYSERQIFEAASSRLARELGAMEQTDEKSALAKILDILNKAAVDPPQGQGAGINSRASRSKAKGAPHGAPFLFALAAILPASVLPNNTADRRNSCASPSPRPSSPLSPPPPPAAMPAARTAGRRFRAIPGREFQQIEVAGPYDVEVRTGAEPERFGAGPQKLLEQDRGRGPRRQARHPSRRASRLASTSAGTHGKADFTVTVPQLRGATIAGSGDIKVDKVKGDRFEGRSPARAASASLARGPDAEARRSPARAASRPAPAHAQSAQYEIAGSGDIDAGAVQPSRPKCRSPARAASRPTPPAPRTSASWARATST